MRFRARYDCTEDASGSGRVGHSPIATRTQPGPGRQDGLISQGRASPGPDGLTCPHLAEITLNTLTGVHVAAATAHDCQLEYYDTRVVHMICVQPAHGMIT